MSLTRTRTLRQPLGRSRAGWRRGATASRRCWASSTTSTGKTTSTSTSTSARQRLVNRRALSAHCCSGTSIAVRTRVFAPMVLVLVVVCGGCVVHIGSLMGADDSLQDSLLTRCNQLCSLGARTTPPGCGCCARRTTTPAAPATASWRQRASSSARRFPSGRCVHARTARTHCTHALHARTARTHCSVGAHPVTVRGGGEGEGWKTCTLTHTTDCPPCRGPSYSALLLRPTPTAHCSRTARTDPLPRGLRLHPNCTPPALLSLSLSPSWTPTTPAMPLPRRPTSRCSATAAT